jgi:AcrR family transcriptional regulator
MAENNKTRTRRDERREQILNAALRVISRHGLRKTTMEDIAEAAHMRAASLYYYFRTKEEVLSAALSSMGEAFLNEIRTAVETVDSGAEKLEAYLNTRQAIHARMNTAFDFTTEVALEVMPVVHETMEDIVRSDHRLAVEILEHSIDDGTLETKDVEHAAATIQACLLGTQLACQIHDFDAQIVSPTLVELLLRGLISRTTPKSDKGASQ